MGKGRPPGATGFIGVGKYVNIGSGDTKYRAFIRHGKKQRSLGTFPTLEAAAKQYDCTALALHGTKAHLNFSAGNYTDEEIKAARRVLDKRNIKTSVYKGVSVAPNARFTAKTNWQCKRIYLGTYESEQYAAQQHDLVLIHLYGGSVTAVPPYRLNFSQYWSQHTPEAIKQLLPRVAAFVAAGLLQGIVRSEQANSVQAEAIQQPVSQAPTGTQPDVSLNNGQQPQLLKRPLVSSESGSDASAPPKSPAPPAKRQRLGRNACLAGQQASSRCCLPSDMPIQQPMQQGVTDRHAVLPVTAAVPPAALHQQTAPLARAPAVAQRSKQAVGMMLHPIKAGNSQQQHLNKAQLPGGKAAAAAAAAAPSTARESQASRPIAQPGIMEQQQHQLQQLLPDDLHAAAVLLYCADDAYSEAKAAVLPRQQLKSCRRDVQAAVQQLATAIAQTVVSLVPAPSCREASCPNEQLQQQARRKLKAALHSIQQQQQQQRSLQPPQSPATSLNHSHRPVHKQDVSELSAKERLKRLSDCWFTVGRVAK